MIALFYAFFYVVAINSAEPFDGWSTEKLLDLLQSACSNLFKFSDWYKKDERLIKEFAKQHFMDVKSAAALQLNTVSMKGEHERYKSLAKQLLSLCVKMNNLSKGWWKEAEKHNRQMTDEIRDDVKRYKEYIKPNLIQENCSVTIIGDTGAGK